MRARASVLHMVQFNGIHGCPWCLISAQYAEGSMRYIGQGHPRTHKQVYRDMYLAYGSGGTVNGIKGPSALMNLAGFNLVSGVSVDYMHCVLLGVTRQITDMLFNTSNSTERYYVGAPSCLRKVNDRLLSIEPPHCITRLPRRIDDRCHWKASEWKHWLLYYALPCLDGLLPPEYWRHLAKLSEGVHILLRETLSAQDVGHAENLLSSFVTRCETLYGVAAATFNVHQILHLAENVRQLGPLWANSAFVFEGGNSKLVKSVTAAHGLPHQIVERVVMAQCLNNFIVSAQITKQEQSLCLKFLGHKDILDAIEEDGVTLLGRARRARLTDTEINALRNSSYDASEVECYERFVCKKQVYHSVLYSKPSKSDTTFVEAKHGFFRIEKIVRLPSSTECESLLLCRNVVFLQSSLFPEHIRPCFLSATGALTVIKAKDVIRSCVFIEFAQEQKAFLAIIPNMIERD